MCPWPDIYDHFLPWKNSPAVLTVSFENLVGSRGGGSDQRQLETIGRILDHLGDKRSHDAALRIAKRIFNPSGSTFRKGQIDGWRDEVAPQTEALLNKTLVRQLAEWGYE